MNGGSRASGPTCSGAARAPFLTGSIVSSDRDYQVGALAPPRGGCDRPEGGHTGAIDAQGFPPASHPRRSPQSGSGTAELGLSQVILGVGDLGQATERFRRLGFDVLDGGIHPGVGTANRIIPLGDAYLELLGVVDGHEARAGAYGRALLAAIADGDRLVRWSLRTDEIDGVAAQLALTVERRRRRRPDGEMLTWRAAGLDLALADPTLPFFMQWDRPDQYPGRDPARHANGATGIAGLELTPSDAERFLAWTAGASAPLRQRDAPTSGLWSVSVDTPDGELLIGP